MSLVCLCLLPCLAILCHLYLLPLTPRRSLLRLRIPVLIFVFIPLQVARHADGFTLTAYGATLDVFVRTQEAHRLNAHMQPRRLRDMGRVLVSPMPGALISVAVEVGQEVEEGQEVAVVEAMKMQNLLRAPKKSKVKKISAKAGDTLQLDQVIVEFE